MTATVFRYAARAADGEAHRGTIAAPSESAVLTALRSRALVVTAVRAESRLATTLAGHGGAGRRRAAISFYRSLAALARAGVPLRRALDVAGERCADAAFREAVRGVAAEIDGGASLGEALARRPRIFDALHVAMLRAGEGGGALDAVLERVAALVEREAGARRALRAALTYPAFVLASVAALLTFLLARVVPMFGDLFASFHAQPPAPTRALLAVAATLQRRETLPAAACVAAALASALVAILRTPAGASTFDRLRLALPLLGDLLRKAIAARTGRTIATLLHAGVDVVAAVEAAVPVAESPAYAAALRNVAAALRAGDALSEALARSRLFDALLLALVRAGEESGLVDELLGDAAAHLDAEVAAATAALAAALEPLILITLGLAVGFIVFSVFIPLYALLGSVSS